MANRIYNIIGDIHGRTCWRNLVREDAVNIFVGDYFDPYEFVSQAERMANFRDIVDYKRQHPETVLLYGNHDLHYLVSGEQYSRYEPWYAPAYLQTFRETESLFHGVAYAIADRALVTHAGVTREWYERYIGSYQPESDSLEQVAAKINRLWQENKRAFLFDDNAAEWGDCYGTSPTHSPMWIRPWTLVKHDLFAGTDILQIFGHTQSEGGIEKNRNLICVDCLGTKEQSYVLEL